MTKAEYMALAEARFEAIDNLQQHTDLYWVDQGCENLVRLRVAHQSGKFGLVTELLKAHKAKD